MCVCGQLFNLVLPLICSESGETLSCNQAIEESTYVKTQFLTARCFTEKISHNLKIDPKKWMCVLRLLREEQMEGGGKGSSV